MTRTTHSTGGTRRRLPMTMQLEQHWREDDREAKVHRPRKAQPKRSHRTTTPRNRA